MKEIVFLLAADADVQSAFEYYDSHQPGRGELFMRHLDAALARVRVFSESAPIFYGEYRRLLIHGYPYAIFFTIVGPRLLVAAVMDLRQDPRTITKRLGANE